MSALTVPPELKKITPFIRRAEELDKDNNNAESRLVAYYCRQYAVLQGIPIASSKPSKDCLGLILNALEKEKATMSSFTKDESKFLCRQFADRIFDKADNDDRSGLATKDTARVFYAAASFFEILQQFHEDGVQSEDYEEEKQKTVYAKWKATDILKALKEGRQPTPGGYGENAMENGDEDGGGGKIGSDRGGVDVEAAPGIEPPPVFVPPPVAPSVFVPPPVSLPHSPSTIREDADDEPPEEEQVDFDQGTEVSLGPPPAYPGIADDDARSVATEHFVPSPPPSAETRKAAQPSQIRPSSPRGSPPSSTPKKKSSSFFGLGMMKNRGKVSKAALEDATELTQFALAALESKDTDLAASRLEQALEALRQNN